MPLSAPANDGISRISRRPEPRNPRSAKRKVSLRTNIESFSYLNNIYSVERQTKQYVVNYGDNVEKSKTTASTDPPKKPAEKPVSLHPLKFEEAMRDLLRVKPEPKKGGPTG